MSKPLPLSGSEPKYTQRLWGRTVGVGNNNCYAYAVGDYEKMRLQKVYQVNGLVFVIFLIRIQIVKGYHKELLRITLKRCTWQKLLKNVNRTILKL